MYVAAGGGGRELQQPCSSVASRNKLGCSLAACALALAACALALRLNPPPSLSLPTQKVGCYSEVLRVLKPGGYFAGYEWCATDQYDPTNKEHKEVGRRRGLVPSDLFDH